MSGAKAFDPDKLREHPAYALFFRRYAPFATFGVPNFRGDNRLASTSLTATSRTYGCVIFNQYEILYDFRGSSGTHHVSPVGLDAEMMAEVSGSVVRKRTAGPGIIEFEANTAGANPLVPGSPDIDTFVTAQISFGKALQMRISGEVFGDNFPNLEVFLRCYRSTRSAMLLDARTTGNRRSGPVTRLAGAHRSQSLGRFSAELPLHNGQLTTDYSTGPTVMHESRPRAPMRHGEW
jgi:hypothetical protein